MHGKSEGPKGSVMNFFLKKKKRKSNYRSFNKYTGHAIENLNFTGEETVVQIVRVSCPDTQGDRSKTENRTQVF